MYQIPAPGPLYRQKGDVRAVSCAEAEPALQGRSEKRMQVEILGALSVVCGDNRLRLAGEKAQVTLALLALTTAR
jgi:hypothetical protein